MEQTRPGKLKPCRRCGGEDYFLRAQRYCATCRVEIHQTPEAKQKREAQQQCSTAIRSGALVRQNCFACQVLGREPDGKTTHAHHEDYSKPLDVVWLCPAHHKWRHDEIAQGVPASESRYLNPKPKPKQAAA